jgi:hypothetical protein
MRIDAASTLIGAYMPLKHSKSDKAFKENIKTEVKTKPIKQAVAIAYAVKRAAEKPKKNK